jgi:hypothetical protein
VCGAGLDCFGEIEFRFFFFACSCKGQVKMRSDVALPASMLRSNLFFVRVNRFWCVWIRAPVLVFHVSGERKIGLCSFVMGCLT